MIAGLGSIGRRHLRNLAALGQTDIVLYRTHRSTLPEDELAEYPMETDLSTALAHRPDGVIVANPTAVHMAVAVPAARAGCHLLLEKPIAEPSDPQVDLLRRLVHENNVRTLVGFQFRFHPVLRMVKALVDSGELGHVLSFRVHWGEYLPGWHPWEDYRKGYAARKDLGGGVVNTLCHPLDYVRWLFGEVEALSALTDHVSEMDLDVEDLAEITLRFQNGVVGSVHLDYFQRPPQHFLTVNLEQGQIHWENESGAAQVYRVSAQTWDRITPPEGFERNDLFLEELRHFLSLVRGETVSRCSLEDGIQVLRLVQAVHESNRSGKWLRMA